MPKLKACLKMAWLKYVTVGLITIICLLLMGGTIIIGIKKPYQLGMLMRVDFCFIVLLVLTYKKWFSNRIRG